MGKKFSTCLKDKLNQPALFIVGSNSESIKKSVNNVSKLIEMITTSRNDIFNIKFYRQLYDQLKPNFQNYGLFDHEKYPLSANNSQFMQNTYGCSDRKFGIAQSYLHRFGNNKIYSSYAKRMWTRTYVKLISSATTTIYLKAKNKQSKVGDAAKTTEVNKYAMYWCDICEGITYNFDNNINRNTFYICKVLDPNTWLSYIGGDRSEGSYISSVATVTQRNSASALNSVPIQIVAGNCDDGAVSLRIMQNNIAGRQAECCQLFKFPVNITLLKYKIDSNKLVSRYVSSSIVLIDMDTQIKLDARLKEEHSYNPQKLPHPNTIPQPQPKPLLNIAKVKHSKNEWKRTLGLSLYIFIHIHIHIHIVIHIHILVV